MASFSVLPGDLADGSATLSEAEFVLLGGHGDAAAGTPVSEAWATFADTSDRLSRRSAAAVASLTRALGNAGQAYQSADDSVAGSLEG